MAIKILCKGCHFFAKTCKILSTRVCILRPREVAKSVNLPKKKDVEMCVNFTLKIDLSLLYFLRALLSTSLLEGSGAGSEGFII